MLVVLLPGLAAQIVRAALAFSFFEKTYYVTILIMKCTRYRDIDFDNYWYFYG